MLIRPPVVRSMRQNLWAQMSGQSYPAATPVPHSVGESAGEPATETRLAQLRELGELRDSGVLTDVEFEREKARILDQ